MIESELIFVRRNFGKLGAYVRVMINWSLKKIGLRVWY
jgi:hypothetical protein